MAIKTINDANLTAIANAIRAKGVEGSWTPSQMPSAIASITSGGGGGSNLPQKDVSIEELYQKHRGNLPPLIDAKIVFDMYKNGEIELTANNTYTYVYTQLLIKPASDANFYSWADGDTVLGNYDESGNFVPYYHQPYLSNSTEISGKIQWSEYNGYEYTVAAFFSASYFYPYLSGTAFSYSNPTVVDVDVYYNGRISFNSKYYFRRWDLAFPGMKYVRVQKGPDGYYKADVSTDDPAFYYNSNGVLRIVRDMDIYVNSTGNGLWFSGKLIGFKGLSTESNDTVYGQGFIPNAVYYESGPMSMRSVNSLPIPNIIQIGTECLKMTIKNQTPAYISLPTSGVYTEVYFGDNVAITNASMSFSNVYSMDQLLGLAKSLPDRSTIQTASPVIVINSSARVPVSLYQEELQPLFDKGWTISGGI